MNIFKRIAEWYRNQKEEDIKKQNEIEKKSIIEKSDELFQIREFLGELWLTYNGNCVCPMSMFKSDTLYALKEMRNLYIEYNLYKRHISDIQPRVNYGVDVIEKMKQMAHE